VFRQSAKEAQFDDLARPAAEAIQIAERFVERDQVAVNRLRRFIRLFEREPQAVSVAPARALTAGVIHQNPSHLPRGDDEEMGAVLPFDPPVAEQPQVDFVDQSRRLKRVINAFLPQVLAGEQSQFVVNQSEEFGRGFQVSVAEGGDLRGEIFGVWEEHRQLSNQTTNKVTGRGFRPAEYITREING
jgi:hypothetical protein